MDLSRLFFPRRGMKFQFMSDIHLEAIRYDFTVPVQAPYLILAGDIGRFKDAERYETFLRSLSGFERVLLVFGNHEFYGTSRLEGFEVAKGFEERIPNLTILNRTRVDLDFVTILGCTLQSEIAPDAMKTNDFKQIRDWTVAQHNEEHKKDLQWLRESIQSIGNESPKRKVVVVTHYAPSFENTGRPDQYRSAASSCFCSDLSSSVPFWAGADSVRYWIWGHTHWNSQFNIGSIIALSNHRMNPFGEKQPRRKFWPRKSNVGAAFDVKKVIYIK